MTTLVLLTIIWVALGGALAALLSIEFLMRKGSKYKWLYVGCYALVSVLTLYHTLIMTPWTRHLITRVGLIDIPMQFTLAPLVYLAFKNALEDKFSLSVSRLWHGILPLLAWISYGLMQLGATNNHLLLATMPNLPVVIRLLWVASIVSIGIYITPLLWKYTLKTPIWRVSKIGKPLVAILIYLMAELLVIALGGLTLLPPLMVLGNLMTTGLIIMVFLVSAQYPEFAPALVKFEENYTKSTLQYVDLNRIQKKIDYFITQKGYTDPDLSLSTCAKQFGLTSHQLSEYINTHYSLNFKQWLNQHRINDAKTALKTNPELTVLAIGLSVGFNSASTFYAVFKAITGHSPNDFRQND